jgi:D-lactate dehydrogenase (cytochrome)
MLNFRSPMSPTSKSDGNEWLIVQKALSLGGTCTGEHGVGIGKAKYLPAEHGEALDVMRDIKSLLDPNGILNPGKIFREGGH